jgi:hypothetical protein
VGVNLDSTKMSDPQANHYEATTDINVKLMEAMEERMTEGALQPSHFYTSYLPGKVMFSTFLPESCGRILLEQIRIFVIPASACTYRLTARVFETLDFDKRKERYCILSRTCSASAVATTRLVSAVATTRLVSAVATTRLVSAVGVATARSASAVATTRRVWRQPSRLS